MSATLDCVSAPGRHYPGDVVTFFVRAEQAKNHRLRLVLPEGVTLQLYRVPDPMMGRVPYTSSQNDLLEWELLDDLNAWDVEVEVHLLPTYASLTLAVVVQLLPIGAEEIIAEAWATVQVEPKSHYLRYLPALYARDDFMGRFLMLFESFWNPIDNQISGLANYFDPMLTPARLLGWLGSWLNVELDKQLPEARQRHLIQRAARLYRQRGTKTGLEAMLELWTDGKATIVEHRSENLRLGKTMRLGRGVALGRRNAPHSFTIRLALPTIEGEEPPHRQQRIEQARPIVEQLLHAEKPAHTTYTLEMS
jgi:phage tail-like protein